jgi:two-component system, cell cycle sensor histidine kinase and response regulator CckA
MLETFTPTPSPAISAAAASAAENPFSANIADFFEQSPLAAWIFDLETLKIVSVNASATREFGWSRDEFLGKTADQLEPPTATAAFRSNLSELRLSKDGVRTVSGCSLVGKSGATRRVEAVWQMITFQERSAVHATIIDRTEQYEAQEENQELAEVLNLASEAIIICDLDREILFWNQGAVKIYGWSADEALGRKVHDVFKLDADTTLKCMSGLLEKGQWQGDIPNARKDGTQAFVTSRWTLARDEQTKQPKCVLMINSDITERKKLEAQFLRAQRLDGIGTLASGIAHDLNNILSPILMATGILRHSKLSDDDQKMLGIIEGSAERGAGIVKQVLTFARGADGERVPLQPKHIVTEMTKVMAQTFPKNLNVQTKLAPNLWMVTGDATQLHQILLNLCVNARDAIGEKGGSIQITAENVEVDQQLASMNPGSQLGPHVCVSVGDTGSGMSPEVMERIFDPFFTTKEQGKGTGLGLATVIGIVKGHKGFITLQSQIGIGTTFRVFLPANVEARDAAADASEIEAMQGHGETLLVVDDEANIREAIVTTLQVHGYHCYTAEDGTDALALFFERRQNISAVITDLHMGVMDGIELTRSLRRLAPETKIIVSSGHISAEKRATLEGLGVRALLEKPYTAEKLLRSVKNALAQTEPVLDIVQ